VAAPMSEHTGHRTRRARGAPGEHPQSSDEQNRGDGGLDGIAEGRSQRRPPAHRWRGRRRAGPENVATIGRESNSSSDNEEVVFREDCREAGGALRVEHVDGGRSVEGRLHGGGEQGHQLRDVVKGVEIEDGVLDGGLAVWRDHGVSQAAVLVDDVGVGEHAVAGAARVGDDPVAGAVVFERQTNLGRQPLVHRALVVRPPQPMIAAVPASSRAVTPSTG
jgi:hypothetical protein